MMISRHHWRIRPERRMLYRILGLALETVATMALIYVLVVLALLV